MNGMSPQLKAVFDLVSNLRRETHRNIFSFKPSEILCRLDDSGDSTKYGIDAKVLRESLNELAEGKFIKLDYVEEVELDNNYVDYQWKYGKDDWVYEEVQCGQDIRNFFGKVYFNISQSEIKGVNDVSEKKHIATLSYEDPHFIVDCDNEKYIIPGLEYGAPYTILNYIMQKNLVNKLVTKKMLLDECDDLKQIKNKSFVSDVFKNNSQVKILKPFIVLKAQSIMILPAKKLTPRELQVIIDVSK